MDVLALAKINALKKSGGVGYDTRKSAPLTLEWDGVIGERETNNFMYQTFVKLSDCTPTYEEITQAEIYMYAPSAGNIKLENPEFMDGRSEGIPLIAASQGGEVPLCLFILDGFEMEGMSFAKGVYSCYLGNDEKTYVSKIHFPSVTTGELKTIDPKFLPSGCVDLYFALGMIDDDPSNPYLYTSPNVNDESKRVTLAQMNEYLAEKKLLRFWCSEDGFVLGYTMEYSFSATPEVSAVSIRMLGVDAMFEIS